jgi:acyl-CoA synthetase (AMP-forming)/AMP-acid ligase II/acyl carrier protein
MATNFDERFSALSPTKKALLEKIKKAKQNLTNSAEQRSIPKRSAPRTPARLSFSQQRLWFLDQLEGQNATYNMPSAVALNGPLNLDVLQQVFSAICARHESLRTSFIQSGNETYQSVRESNDVDLTFVNLEELSPSFQVQEYDRLTHSFCHETFDLAKDNLLRLKLIRFEKNKHILLLVIHHIISDGWSNGNVLLKEICTLYEAFSQKRPSPLAPLSIQYADFAEWQREILQGPYADKLISFWAKKLQNIPSLIALPTDRPRPLKQTFAGKTAYFSISKETLHALKILGKPLGASLFAVLLAGFYSLLARYSREDTIVVGTPVANRSNSELEGLIGFFVNTLVLRMDINPTASCVELISAVQKMFLEAYEHQDLPFERLVEAIKPERNPSFSPLFQVMLILQNQNQERAGLRIGDLHLSAIPVAADTSMFDLTLKLEEQNSQLDCELEYNTDLFDASTMKRFTEHFKNMLKGFVNRSDQAISTIPILSPDEVQLIVSDFNQTRQHYSETETICSLFEAQARQYPDRIAVLFEDQQITYGELNLRASHLASYLTQRGAQTETLVGLCIERSIHLLVGILGILKAGAAYVPIDPNYPSNRINGMISAAKITLIVGETSTASMLPVDSTELVCIDASWDQINTANPKRYLCTKQKLLPDSLAYVIFTSGSTGQPKGVQISHRALHNFLQTMQHQPGCQHDDTLLALTTISFDIAALELYLPLISGARIALVPRQTASDGIALAKLVHSTQANVMQATPAGWRLLFAAVEPEHLALDKALCGGEALTAELASKLLKGKSEVWNVYGPTETTIWSTRNKLNGKFLNGNVSPSIGRPIANTEVYIFDRNFDVTALGVAGELYIGGLGLSRGYLYQPALTAERFIPSPYSTEPGERIYRTGDVVRYIAGGDIEYIERADFQIKLRGFRIELGEIESVLAQHRSVKNAVAVCQSSGNEQVTLNAFIEVKTEPLDAAQQEMQGGEILEKWQTVWDQIYDSEIVDELTNSDFNGWISSYTGKQIPNIEMQAWVDETINKILKLHPKRIMEIGCGSGLLMLRLASRAEHYTGIDFSKTVLSTLHRRLEKQRILNTQLICRAANQFVAEETQSVDTVIINSVSQYFPSVQYFLQVIKSAIHATRNKGQIFIGDVRAKCMLELQTVSVLASHVENFPSVSSLRENLKNRVDAEEELLLDPYFFVQLRQQFPEMSGLAFDLKRTPHPNEMNKFRYDVLINIDRTNVTPKVQSAVRELDAQKSEASITQIQFELKNGSTPLLIKNISNKRLALDVQTLNWVKKTESESLDGLKAILESSDSLKEKGLDPDELHGLADELGLEVHMIWSPHDAGQFIHALFFTKSLSENLLSDEDYFYPAGTFNMAQAQEVFATNPLDNSNARAIIKELRALIEAQLPSYMAPSNITILDRLPLTPNGKIDRKALPNIQVKAVNEQYVAPRDARDEQMLNIWSSVLNMPRVGIANNFFNLGGHSLLAVQVISRIRDQFLIELPIQALFDNPTVESLTTYLDVNQALIKRINPPIEAQSTKQRALAPLSFSQKRLWFLDQLDGPNANYHISIAVELLGEVNTDALDQALIMIVERHEVLRTIYTQLDGEPRAQVVATPSNVLQQTNVESLRVDIAQIDAWLNGQQSRPFILSQEIPLRAGLYQFKKNHYALSITIHHIAADEWSMVLLQQELMSLYDAIINRKPAALEPLPIQYADYANWQKRWLSAERIHAQLEYWKNQLAHAPTLLDFPYDKPRPAVQGHRGQAVTFVIDATLNQQFNILCSGNDVTKFMGLLACYAALLSKYSNVSDLIIGTPVTHRNRSELKDLIGFFVNTLPIRFQFNPHMSAVELLADVRKTLLNGLANQDTPFESIVDAIHPERSLSHAPIFQHMFVLLNASEANNKSSGIELLPIATEITTSKFDLTLSIEEISGVLHCTFEYNLDLFEASTIETLSTYYCALIKSMVSKPYAPILQTQLLSAAEQQNYLGVLTTAHDAKALCSVQQLFETQARLKPDAIAICQKDDCLTFGELNLLSNRLARELRHRNVGPDTVIGLLFEPSVGMLISMLGVLKAGGAYLPILPSTPADRVTMMLNEAHAEILICADTQSAQPNGVVQKLYLSALLANSWSDKDPDWYFPEDSLAYVIYTSGSTGTPKGVGVTRANLAAYLDSRLNFYSQTVTGLLLLQPYAFDIASGNIFWTLCQGGTLYLEDTGLAGSPDPLIRRIADSQISHLVLLPLLYRPVLERATTHDFASLKHVTLGGENLLPDLAQKHFQLFPNVLLTNEYGPTETTIMCTAFTVQKDQKDEPIPIGASVRWAPIRLLDPFLELGLPNLGGELMIGGPQVSRGYLSQAALTAEKFIPDPYATDPGRRMYRSGDFGRYLQNGTILFQGRKDKQVKIRGFRIELAEIENALLTLPNIKDACAVIVDREKTPRLYAYLVTDIVHETSVESVIKALQKILPDYMLPAGMSFLRALPLTTNGKLDLNALPSPNFTDALADFTAPRNDVEEILCRVWKDVLGLKQVGVYDNFFNLGGDSILSIQIVSRVNQLGLTLSVKQLFQHQTIAELATVVTQTRRAAISQERVHGPFALGPIQHWFFENFKANPHHFNQSVYLQINRDIEVSELNRALTHLVSQHDLLRAKFPLSLDQALGARPSIQDAVDVPLIEFVDLSLSIETDKDSVVRDIANSRQTALNIIEGQLVRAILFKYDDDQPNRLLIIIHHLVIDGISWRILLSDLEELLSQIKKNHTVQLRTKTSSFKSWTTALYAYSQSDDALHDLAYWRTQIVQSTLAFPKDYEVNLSRNTLDSVVYVEKSLDPERTRSLLTKVPQAYRTQINDILLTALVKSLAIWANVTEFDVAMESHGREDLFEDLDISRTVGWFTSLFPLRLADRRNEPLGDTILRIKDQIKQIPNNGITYGVLRYLHPDETIRASLAQPQPSPVSFNYLGQFDQDAKGQFLLGEAQGNTGSDISLKESRQALIDINSRISGGQFIFNVSFSTHLYKLATIENLANLYIDQLQTIIEHCESGQYGSYAAIDFPLAKLSSKDYHDLYQEYKGDIEDIYPLSPMQEGMAFHSQYSEASGAYIIQLSCDMSGDFDSDAFENAWKITIARHPSLRAFIFSGENLQNHQVILRSVHLPWVIFDWTTQTSTQQDAAWEEVLLNDRTRDYDLGSAPVMRFYLVKLSSTNWRFLWSHHHILTDGWCLPILMKEVLHLYAQPDSHDISQPVPYRNYIAWLSHQDIEQAKSYWLKYLEHFSAPTSLGIERDVRQATNVLSHDYQDLSDILSKELSTSLNTLTKTYRLTLSNVIQGAWALLLGIYSQTSDVVFGATVSGRPPALPGVEEMVGLFINTLPVRAKINPQQTIVEFLKALLNEQINSDQFSYTPLVTIQACSSLPSRTPLFRSILVFENYPLDSDIIGDAKALSMDGLQIHEQTNFPLTLTASGGDQIPIKISFDQSIIDPEKITRLLAHFKNILNFAASYPDALLTEWMACAITNEENLALTKALHATTETSTLRPETLCTLFEKQVLSSPDRIALCMGDQRLSYDELNQKANQLARQMISMGAKPSDLIGVCLDRSPDLIIAILAVHKIAAAYVPIDPDYPPQRVSYMLADSQATILIYDPTKVRDESNATERCQFLPIDHQRLEQFSSTNLLTPYSAHQVAYVIYTSGTTGNPKGVQISQAALVNFLLSMQRQPGIDESDSVLAVTTISFDIAGLEIFLPLISGAKVIMVAREEAADGMALLANLRQGEATIMQATPITWRLLFEAGWDGTGLKQVWCGGEAFPIDLANLLVKTPAKIWNLYGPTETTIWSTQFHLASNIETSVSVPIGKPISNTSIILQDRYGNLLPKGIAGELFIGGLGLANGYLNRPALTAEKFIPDAFGQIGGARLYSTGDIAKYSIDDNLICLGRSDQQIKLRGFRIEPGEIEMTIQKHVSVKQAVVQVIEFSESDQRLATFVIAKDKSTFDLELIKNWLRTQLPPHMLPTEWIVLDSFPLTPNGKLDKKALPRPTSIRTIQYSPPQTPTERTLQSLMAEVLNLVQISRDADFFDLGGHSLLATRLAARLKQHFELNIPLLVIFEKATIAQLGQHIDNLVWGTQQSTAATLPLSDDEEEFKL